MIFPPAFPIQLSPNGAYVFGNTAGAVSTSGSNQTIPYLVLTGDLPTGVVNMGIALVPTGTGGFALALPDGTATGGNVRGANAVDLQTVRSAASQVASGQGSFAGGSSNTASGLYSSVLGFSNVASGVGSSARGVSTLATQHYEDAYGAGKVTAGDNQTSRMQLYFACTAASTNYNLTSDASAASTTNQVPVPLNTAIAFWGYVVATQKGSDGTNFVAWKIEGMAQRGASGNVAIVGTPTVTALGSVPTGWTCVVQADTTNQAVQVVFNMGTTAMNIHANAAVHWVKNLYA